MAIVQNDIGVSVQYEHFHTILHKPFLSVSILVSVKWVVCDCVVVFVLTETDTVTDFIGFFIGLGLGLCLIQTDRLPRRYNGLGDPYE